MTIKKCHTVGAIVLMAGQSTRMPEVNKLLLKLPDGRTMAEQTIEVLTDAGFDPIMVVTGHDAVNVRLCVEHLGVQFVHNDDYQQGMGTSISTALKTITGWDAALVALGDMPLISVESVQEMHRTHMENPDAIVAPVYNDQRGNPVIFPHDLFEELGDCKGDVGGKEIVKEHSDRLVVVNVEECGILIDVDTSEEFESVLATLERR